jgi:hypothetical protein
MLVLSVALIFDNVDVPEYLVLVVPAVVFAATGFALNLRVRTVS